MKVSSRRAENMARVSTFLLMAENIPGNGLKASMMFR